MSASEEFEQAILDAECGHFEHLPAWGIEAELAGDLVRVRCAGAEQLVLNTPEALAAAFHSIVPELTYREYCQH